jgi:hypothetical protein
MTTVSPKAAHNIRTSHNFPYKPHLEILQTSNISLMVSEYIVKDGGKITFSSLEFSAVDWTTEESWFNSRKKSKSFRVSKTTITAQGPTQPLV